MDHLLGRGKPGFNLGGVQWRTESAECILATQPAFAHAGDFGHGIIILQTSAMGEARATYQTVQRECLEGGDRHEAWPPEVVDLLKGFLPVQNPPNYQLVADGMERLCNFKRARATVESYVKTNLSHLVPTPPPKKRRYRRFRRAHVGELWQHDSSIHQWWPAPHKQTLLLTIDDCSDLFVAGRFVDRDTTWNQDYEIAPTSRKAITVLFHPFRKLWVLDHSPKLNWPPILGHFTLKSVWFCSGKKSSFEPAPTACRKLLDKPAPVRK